jgi:hypothetical protein
VRDDAEPVLVDEQVPVPERPALRPTHRPPRREIKSISTSKNTSKKGNRIKNRREKRAGGRLITGICRWWTHGRAGRACPASSSAGSSG